MKYRQIIKFSIIGIVTNLTRSLLTTLGIVIGIASVIGLMGLGQGAQDQILEQISSLGIDTVTLTPAGATGNPLESGNGKLTKDDYDYINNESRFPNITAVSPNINGKGVVRKGSEEISISISGVSQNYAEISGLKIESGTFLREQDIDGQSNVVVIGHDIATQLFEEMSLDDIIGEYVTLENIKFKIRGVLEAQNSGQFSNPNEDIYIPYTTAMYRIIQTDEFSYIVFQVREENLINITKSQVKEKLSGYRGFTVEEADFDLFSSGDLQETASQITGILTALLSSVAAISLIVGGIGIMNIMLVSVTERTKEIGLRKAVGAKRNEILLQFLFESIILTFMGGLIGIILGILLGQIIGNLVNIQSSVKMSSILLATGVSVAIGIIFGFYPAFRASKLDPIDALRYE